MVNQLTIEQRSALMARIRGKDTKPELVVRRLLHRMGVRFRLHRKDLPGTPDVVLPGRKKIVFIHGCYWHGHRCSAGRLPKSRVEFCSAKIAGNRLRDARNVRALRRNGVVGLSALGMSNAEDFKTSSWPQTFLDEDARGQCQVERVSWRSGTKGKLKARFAAA
jgi:DNA mismatch endonuclease, patch repair protein